MTLRTKINTFLMKHAQLNIIQDDYFVIGHLKYKWF